jgi:membrane-associated PAP2 superfamily phosphatase
MTEPQFRQYLTALLLAAVVLIGINRYTNIDLLLSDWMYDDTLRDFPWRDSWFATVVMHRWAKFLFAGAGIAIGALLIAELVFRRGWFTVSVRRKLAVVVVCSVLVPLVVSIIKSQSIHHCPWDLQRYGGFAPFLRLFDQLPAGMKPGHCFPAGHATSALWLPAIAVFWLPERPRAAAAVFLASLLPGLAMGWVQQLRGAHFLSHTLWSAWIAGFIVLVVARLLWYRR